MAAYTRAFDKKYSTGLHQSMLNNGFPGSQIAMCLKTIDALTVADLKEYPVWRFVNAHDSSATAVQPVRRLPCSHLTGNVVGTRVTLADGSKCWALLGNIAPTDVRLTEQFLAMSIERDGKWFHLARYHDYNATENGPEALATWLDKDVDRIFPIHYDIRSVAVGDPAALAAQVRKEPRERLTREEIIALAVP